MLPLALLLALALAAIGWLCALRRRDHHRLRALGESESRFRILFDRSPDASALFESGTGRFTHCNEAALRLLKAEREWIIGKHPWDVAPAMQPDGQPSQASAWRIIQDVNRLGSTRFEWQHRRGDGTEFPAEISITALESTEHPLWMAIIRDMTEWKRAQQAAAEANHLLEQRVAERTAELARSNEQLQEAERELRRALAAERELSELKSNFVSMVSHEFRTPLGIISSSAQILDRYLHRLDAEGRREHLSAIQTAVRRMGAMMENVLLLSHLDRTRIIFAPAPLPLEPFCRSLLDEMHSATSAPLPIRFEMAPEVPPCVVADEALLRHILTNLLSNAVKYSPPDRAASLSLGWKEGALSLRVADEGIGIPEADREHLFQSFRRGTNVGQRPGTGLGLLLVKRCCELHGATIEFDSELGRGTAFTVHLPLPHSA